MQEKKLWFKANPSETDARPRMWFRAKTYGWGWTPSSWQGWAVLAMYLFAVLSNIFYVNHTATTSAEFLKQYILQTYILTVFLLIICWLTGEKPEWRWGKKKNTEEYVDVLDEQGEKTGEVVTRAKTYATGKWSAASDVWILNENNEVLLQLRSPKKENNPNTWDISAAGRIASGETSLSGAMREAKEELGISLHPDELTYIGTVRESDVFSSDRIVNVFSSVYVVRKNLRREDLKLQESEVADVAWVPIEEFRRRVESKDSTLCPHTAEYQLLFDFLDNTHGSR